jgi:hypothetical protein
MATKWHKNPGADEAIEAPIGARDFSANLHEAFLCLFVANPAVV